jgi:hypothetical protein
LPYTIYCETKKSHSGDSYDEDFGDQLNQEIVVDSKVYPNAYLSRPPTRDSNHIVKKGPSVDGCIIGYA